MCVLDDRHAGLLLTVKKLNEDVTEELPWLDLHSR